jgi:hypothetical protein
MATFLQLVNLARTEAGVAGGELVTLQTGLSTESSRFKTWVANAWNDIQTSQPDWQFMRFSGEFDTSPNQAMYTPQQAKATNDGTASGTPILGAWKRDSFRVSTAGNNYADEMLCGYMPWWQYRNLYQYGTMRAQRSRPVVFSIDPQKNLYFGIIPDGAYTIGYEFYRTPVTLSADADAPVMPDRFHNLIAYKALRAYGIFMSAPEVIGRADDRISQLEPALLIDQLLPVESGAPLA